MSSADLASWLLEQIAEDERVAQDAIGTAAFQRQTGKWRVERTAYGGSLIVFAIASDGAKTQAADLTAAWEGDERAAHIATWDPARVLAECEAKRAIIERVPAVIKHYAPFEREWEWCPKARTEPWGDLSWGPDSECECGADEENAHGGNWFLRVLALPYADRPGYREEWRP